MSSTEPSTYKPVPDHKVERIQANARRALERGNSTVVVSASQTASMTTELLEGREAIDNMMQGVQLAATLAVYQFIDRVLRTEGLEGEPNHRLVLLTAKQQLAEHLSERSEEILEGGDGDAPHA
jgi:hypothetical protein